MIDDAVLAASIAKKIPSIRYRLRKHSIDLNLTRHARTSTALGRCDRRVAQAFIGKILDALRRTVPSVTRASPQPNARRVDRTSTRVRARSTF